MKVLSPNHWTAREFPAIVFYNTHFNTTVYECDINKYAYFEWYELESFTDELHNEDRLETNALKEST